MANKKLTDLTELTTPADGDFLYIVDVSDTTESAQGTSKKIRKDKVDSGASKENIANKQNSLAIDGTGTKYPTVDAVNAGLPINYSKIVYVNATSPITATIFDTENPPVTNDNTLKNDVANLYIGTDASTWVYNSTTYVTKTVTATSSNFYLAGTTTDAGNTKTGHIARSGAVTLTGPLNILNLKISSTPNTSVGSADILTRNPSTTALEKKLVSDFLQTTGTQSSITGRKNFASTNSIAGGLGILNQRNSGSDQEGLAIYNSGTTGLYIENTSGGGGVNALSLVNSTSGVGLKMDNFSNGNLLTLRNQGGTGDLLYAELGKVTISSTGKLSTTEVPTVGNNVTNKTYIDGKITQTITNGVTDKSPSEDAVYDALANVTRNIVKNTVPSSVLTGTVSETILASYFIPANTFSSSDLINVQSLKFKKSGTAAQAPVKIYTNTANTLTGAVQLAMYNITATASLGKINRTLTLYGGDLYTINPALSATTDSTSGSITTVTFNTTIDNYILIIGKLDNSGDSLTLIETLISK